MSFILPFSNPYMTPFSNQLEVPEPARRKSSSSSDNTFVFQDDFEEPKFVTASDLPADEDLKFKSSFRNSLPPKAHSHSRLLSSFENPISVSPQKTLCLSPSRSSPQFLSLVRSGLTNTTTLFDPTTKKPIYRFHDTGREYFSLKHDIEATRIVPEPSPIGTLRFGPFATEVHKTSFPTKRWTNIQKLYSPSLLSSRHIEKPLIWKITKTRRKLRKPVFTRPSEHANYMNNLLYQSTEDELVVLELREQNKDLDNDPICVVHLYATLPRATFELRVPPMWENPKEWDWAAFDELIMSAYANMDLARRRLMSGSSVEGTSSTYRVTAGDWSFVT